MIDTTEKKYFSKQITERFLFAMDRILGNRSTGKVTALMFGDMVGMRSSNITRLREPASENYVSVEAIGRICEIYKISAHWLITGQGTMWSNDELFTAFNTLEKRMTDIEEAVNKIEISVGMKKSKTGKK